MAVKIGTTSVISDNRVLENVSGLKTVGGSSILGSGDIGVGDGPGFNGTTAQNLGNVAINNSITLTAGHWYSIVGSVDNQGGPSSFGIGGSSSIRVPQSGVQNGAINNGNVGLQRGGVATFYVPTSNNVQVTCTSNRGRCVVYRIGQT